MQKNSSWLCQKSSSTWGITFSFSFDFARILFELIFFLSQITTPLKLTLGTGEVGEILCDYIPKNKIDFLVMGRRGMGTFKRLFLGSNSKYCVEHADCNVIIIKHPFGPEEVHEGSKAEAIAAEEEERQWRIHEYEKKLEAEAKQQEEDSKKDLELVKKMEEEERERREKEDHGGESVSGRDE